MAPNPLSPPLLSGQQPTILSYLQISEVFVYIAIGMPNEGHHVYNRFGFNESKLIEAPSSVIGDHNRDLVFAY